MPIHRTLELNSAADDDFAGIGRRTLLFDDGKRMGGKRMRDYCRIELNFMRIV